MYQQPCVNFFLWLTGEIHVVAIHLEDPVSGAHVISNGKEFVINFLYKRITRKIWAGRNLPICR